jgi:hypothetical protein
MPTVEFVIGSLLTASVLGYAGAKSILMFKQASETSISN